MGPVPTVIEDFELEVLELVEERSRRVRKRSNGHVSAGSGAKQQARASGPSSLRERVVEGWAAKVGVPTAAAAAAATSASKAKAALNNTKGDNLKGQRPSSIYAKLFNLFTITSHESGKSAVALGSGPSHALALGSGPRHALALGFGLSPAVCP